MRTLLLTLLVLLVPYSVAHAGGDHPSELYVVNVDKKPSKRFEKFYEALGKAMAPQSAEQWGYNSVSLRTAPYWAAIDPDSCEVRSSSPAAKKAFPQPQTGALSGYLFYCSGKQEGRYAVSLTFYGSHVDAGPRLILRFFPNSGRVGRVVLRNAARTIASFSHGIADGP